MGSVKVTVFGRIKPCDKSLLSEGFRLKFGVNEDFITFSSTKNSTGKKCYRFQKIFNETSSQEQIFDIVAKPVIKNVLAGYNGTIFTYGQTGSGKTFTMTGDIENWVNPGLIPRTIQEIFKSKEKDTVITITYCEIYNEHVYDLIRIDRVESDLPQVSILEDSAGITHFRNLSVHIVNTAYEALQLLSRGDANKMVAETTSNAKSSRSHVIFSIGLEIPHPTQAKFCLKPVLYLVDLAGSEKLSKCKASMANPWETRYINLSLHYLEQVLVALRQPRRAHIPYRNSLMTALLRNSLGGNSITAMIATFSLAVDDIEETIQTCRFAERIALIKNEIKINEIVNTQEEIELLKKENEKLKTQIKLMGSAMVTDELAPEEKDKCIEIIQNYIQGKEGMELPLTDIRKTEYCFSLMREEIKRRKEILERKKPQTDLNLFDLHPQSHCLPNEKPSFISLKKVQSNAKIWRRKRTPVDLPKINITYKKWKSTEELPENENIVYIKTNNDAPSEKEAELVLVPRDDPPPRIEPELISAPIQVPPEESQSTKILLDEYSFYTPLVSREPDTSTYTVGASFSKENMDSIPEQQFFSKGVLLEEDVEDEENIIPLSRSYTKLEDQKILHVQAARTTTYLSEKLSFHKLQDVENVGDLKNVEENVKIQDERQISMDKESVVSCVSSEFSEAGLPLTGDPEVDEEIVRFYRARYEVLRKETSLQNLEKNL